MPYIVTTRRAETRDVPAGEGHPQAEAYRDLVGLASTTEISVSTSRRAVATLEEAKSAARDVVRERGQIGHLLAALSISVSGGSFSLPDGTEIEAERATWASLDRAALIAEHGTTLDPVTHTDRGLDCPESQVGEARQQQILAAYNAAQTVA